MSEVTLKEYIDSRIKSLELQIESLARFNSQHFELNEKAIQKAEEAMLVRLDNMNEFRAQINQERANYATKESVAVTQKVVDKRLNGLEQANAFSAGKMWMVIAGFTVIPTIIAIIALVLR